MKMRITIFVIVLSFLVLPNLCLAQNPQNLNTPGISAYISEDCRLRGDCTLDEFKNFLVFRGYGLLRGIGAFALLMFVVGGVYWIISAGSQDKVETGKKIMVGAVIGIVIIFGAFLIIKVLEDTLGVEKDFRPAEMKASENAD